jgi:hypothetical protein
MFSEGTTFQRKRAASAAKIRPVLPAAVMRSAPFLPEDVVFVAESVGFRSPALSVCEGLEPDAVLYKTGKQCRRSECPIMGTNGRKKDVHSVRRGTRCGRRRVRLGDGKLRRLSENGGQMLGIIDEVDLVAISDYESPTRCGNTDYAERTVDCRNKDLLARWHDGLVLK